MPILLVAAGVLLYDSAPVPVPTSPAHFTSFSVNGKTFKITYIADNQSSITKGLMDTKVTNTTTMLFVFQSAGYYPFWMYNVNSSLDIMWVNLSNGTNTGVFAFLALDSPPCHISVECTTYTPNVKANLVLEAKGGFAAANGIEVGTLVTFH